MSVKGKVKRLNKEILELQDELETERLSNNLLRLRNENNVKQLENIIKFAITNHIGGLYGGMEIDRYGIEKMKELKLKIEYDRECCRYILKVFYGSKEF